MSSSAAYTTQSDGPQPRGEWVHYPVVERPHPVTRESEHSLECWSMRLVGRRRALIVRTSDGALTFTVGRIGEVNQWHSALALQRVQRERDEARAELRAEREARVPREPGCQCTWEIGDSPCPVHPLNPATELPYTAREAGALADQLRDLREAANARLQCACGDADCARCRRLVELLAEQGVA